MKTIFRIIRPLLLAVLSLSGFAVAALAQDVSIPDPGLEAAIRETLQKPDGPLTGQDMLSLTTLTAISRNISNVQGLENAHNLAFLNLESNQLASISFSAGLTNLSFLDLGLNPLVRLSLSPDMTRLASLELFSDQLTILIVPAELRALTAIDLENNRLASLTLPSTL